MRHNSLFFVSLFILLALFFVLNLLLGTVHIPMSDILRILVGNHAVSEIWYNIVWSSRVPQALTATMAGAGLAVSGLQM